MAEGEEGDDGLVDGGMANSCKALCIFCISCNVVCGCTREDSEGEEEGGGDDGMGVEGDEGGGVEEEEEEE